MHNQRSTGMILQNNELAAPRSQSSQMTLAKPVSQLALLSLLTISVVLIGFTARAQDTKQQTADSKKVSGFLGDYSGLAPDPKNGDLLLYEKDRDAMKKYNKFIFDPITIYLLPEARDRGIDPDDLERLAQYFHDAVTDELKKSGRYEIVTTPGPDVLRLNVAITNVEPTGGKKNAAVKGGAAAVSAATVPGVGLAVPRLSVGRVSVEGEMLDSTSGERQVAFVTGRGGRRWFSGLSGLKKWADIEAAFRTWAKNFRQRLDEVHGS
jgi:Protein of unknown function (DUF3313)